MFLYTINKFQELSISDCPWGENLLGWGQETSVDWDGMEKTYLVTGQDGDEIVSSCHCVISITCSSRVDTQKHSMKRV